MSIFFVAEFLSLLLLCLLCYSTWPFFKPSLEESGARDPGLRGYFCALLRRTFGNHRHHSPGGPADTYHPLEVYILDDGASPAVAALAHPSNSIICLDPGRVAPGRFQEWQPQFRVKPQSRGLDPGVRCGPGAGAGNSEPVGRFFPVAAGGFCPEQARFLFAGRRSFLQQRQGILRDHPVEQRPGQCGDLLWFRGGVSPPGPGGDGGIRLLEPAGRFHLVL